MYEIEIRRNSRHQKLGEEVVGVVMCVAVLEYVPLGSSLLINHFRLSVSYTLHQSVHVYIGRVVYDRLAFQTKSKPVWKRQLPNGRGMLCDGGNKDYCMLMHAACEPSR